MTIYITDGAKQAPTKHYVTQNERKNIMKTKLFTIILICSLLLSACASVKSDIKEHPSVQQQENNTQSNGQSNIPNKSESKNDGSSILDNIFGNAGDLIVNESFDAEVGMGAPMYPKPGSGILPPSYIDPPSSGDSSAFGKIVENKFIKASEANTSTFSADVDTASYAYFRKLVNSNSGLKQIIASTNGSLRTEEFINYFNYSYNAPENGELFGITANASHCPWNDDSVLLTIGLKADDAVEKTKNNLVFLIDVSGSMNASDKLQLLQKSFVYLTKNLNEDDTVSIVTYAGQESVVLDGAKGSEKDRILNAINTLKASGATNGESGLKMAYALAEKYMSPDANNRIIMASDGDLNVGISSAEELKSFISTKRDMGVYLSVLGFGMGNYKDSAMEALADNGNGVYYYIDGETEAQRVLEEKLLSTLYTVAKDVKLQLTFNENTVEEYRLIGYENRLINKEDFDDDTKDAGEIGAGHSVTVCYELKLKEGSKGEGNEWMKLAVRYKKPSEDISRLNEYTLNSTIFTETPDEDFKFIGALIQTTMILRESEYTSGKSLQDVQKILNTLNLKNDFYKYQFSELIGMLVE